MKKTIIAIFALFLLTATVLHAQEEQLGRQYLENGEYEKAASIYGELHKKYPTQDYYFSQYIAALTAAKNFAVAETELKKQLKARPENLQLYVIYGDILGKQDRTDDAEKQYKKAIAAVGADPNQLLALKDAFVQRYKNDWALQVLQRGDEVLKEKNYFAYYEAELLRTMNQAPKMVARYLDAMDFNESIEPTLESVFQRYFTEADYVELQAQLYARIQAHSEKISYSELLIWILQQRKDFKGALRQAKALDRRLEENGTRVMNFSRTAELENDYDTAIEGYQYLVEKGNTSPYFVEAQKGLLRCRREKITRGYAYTATDITALETQYAAFVNQYGWNGGNAEIIREWAKLEVYYKNDLPQGILLVDSLLHIPRLIPKMAGEAKLELGDYYLMHDEPWEATLLYSQVDKAFKEDDLGETGRYKNAKLAYYNGDFEWAQTQLKILKASTSELISNDAIDLSAFISDNLNLDTSAVAMKYYATAELLTFQNRFAEAFEKLDSLTAKFPKHSLEDDIFYAKAQIFKKQRNYTAAAAQLQAIIEQYPEEIRGDNAVMELAELYEKIITNYTGSTFIIEARKRYRALRGDKSVQ
jgi:hypothetical protein